MAKAQFDFTLVNTIEQENMKAPYIDENPNGTVPMLSLGTTKVIGDSESLFNFVVNTNNDISGHFHHSAQEKKIKEILRYFTRTIRQVSAKLIQAVAN